MLDWYDFKTRSKNIRTELLLGEPHYFDRIYNHYHRDVQQLDCSVSTVQPATNPTIFHKVYPFCPFEQDDMAGIVEAQHD